jgi:hypothetical protein
VEGATDQGWVRLYAGTTIGYRRLIAIEPQRLAGLRVHIEDAVEPPLPLRIRAFG